MPFEAISQQQGPSHLLLPEKLPLPFNPITSRTYLSAHAARLKLVQSIRETQSRQITLAS